MSSLQGAHFMRELLQSGDYSDLTIYCGADVYRIHRAIVCPQSKVLAAMCRGGFKEAQTGEINMPDDDPEAVKMMVSYFYNQDYHMAKDNVCGGKTEPNPILDARTYSIAHKYDVPPLEALAKKKFTNWAADKWDSEDFVRIVQELWLAEEYNDLYDVISDVMAEHIDMLLAMEREELILAGLSSGKLSLEFLRRILLIKNTELDRQYLAYSKLRSRADRIIRRDIWRSEWDVKEDWDRSSCEN
ncbi:hypothetical protein VTN77DRAFT_8119 [Rasamsonia byssochlamydoides]|uniref:uncharacterized protein n=1 Tax=Rasamsonia byssochlamydoides TaxID=89139 RepID=UPI0037427640